MIARELTDQDWIVGELLRPGRYVKVVIFWVLIVYFFSKKASAISRCLLGDHRCLRTAAILFLFMLKFTPIYHCFLLYELQSESST